MNLSELMESVRRVEVRTNRLVNDTMVGAYLSHFKGRGMDFEELREYIPGDDVRDIDWNVSHRLGRPFVKRFREERELTVVLAVDISGSAAFGSRDRTKRERAAEIAATLAFSAAKNGDKVALLLFAGGVECFVPPRKGRRHILRIVRELLARESQHRGTDLVGALRFINHVLPRRAMIFLLTDFLHAHTMAGPRAGAGRDFMAELGLTNARHDVVCLHLVDPLETRLPAAGLVTVEDAETGELLEVDSNRAAVRERFAGLNQARLLELDQALNRTGVETLRLSTHEPFAPAIQRFFELRRGRRRG
ncbi:MAG TPA: DUF58 domain-containing protein [Verrucomicrobiae bacterium]